MSSTRSLRRELVVVLFVLLLGLSISSVTLGTTAISVADVWSALTAPVTGGAEAPSLAVQRIVLDLRLPRAVLALVVGAGLAMVGMLLQTVTRNDLADPFLFGLSSGSAAAAVTVIALVGELLGGWTLPAAAFCGGLLAAACVLSLAAGSRGAGPDRIVLAGLAVSFLFSAITNGVVFAGDQRAAHSVLFWSLGGLGLARWSNLVIPLAGLAAVTVHAVVRHDALDALLVGDETAHSLGIDPERLRTESFIVAAFATASFVALSGVIGFIGLMVPHLARAVGGPLHRRSLPLAALIGSLFMVSSDVASRLLLAPQELPVGIVTASIGATFVIWMLLRKPALHGH